LVPLELITSVMTMPACAVGTMTDAATRAERRE
jgi:hypothetical protein